jgi:hypothetical protein
MIVIVWLLEKFSTLINWLGIMGWIYVYLEGDPVYFYYAIPLLVVGFFFGLFTYDYEMPPRWLWVKTPLEVLNFRVSNAFNNALLFANGLAAFLFVRYLCGNYSLSDLWDF